MQRRSCEEELRAATATPTPGADGALSPGGVGRFGWVHSAWICGEEEVLLDQVSRAVPEMPAACRVRGEQGEVVLDLGKAFHVVLCNILTDQLVEYGEA